MQKDCHGTQLSLSAVTAAQGEPARTRVEIEQRGQRRTLEAPAEMSDYTAVGLACTQDAAGKPYFVVQYGELPYGCEFCEWYFLYDSDGKQLSRSSPPLLEVDGQQSPNNGEYEQLLEKLGIAHPEVEYFKP